MSEISGTDLFGFFEERFGAGKGFTSEYIRYFEWSQNVKLRSAADWEALDATRRMWLDFALSTNRRGEALMDLLETRGPLRGRRYLDIGCGFGGCLVAAARRGAVCAGVESDPLRLDFAGRTPPIGAWRRCWWRPSLWRRELPSGWGGSTSFRSATEWSAADRPEPAYRCEADGESRRIGLRAVPEWRGDPGGGKRRAFRVVRHDAARAATPGGITWEHFHWQYEGGDYYRSTSACGFSNDAGFRAELVNSVWHPASAMSEARG